MSRSMFTAIFRKADGAVGFADRRKKTKFKIQWEIRGDFPSKDDQSDQK